MKRFSISLLISFLFVVGYLFILAAIVAMNNFDYSAVTKIHFPLRLPQTLYFYLFPPTLTDYQPELSNRKAFLGASFLMINVLLYSIPTYLLIGLFSKYGNPTITVETARAVTDFLVSYSVTFNLCFGQFGVHKNRESVGS